jgi:hypothetical protein
MECDTAFRVSLPVVRRITPMSVEGFQRRRGDGTDSYYSEPLRSFPAVSSRKVEEFQRCGLIGMFLHLSEEESTDRVVTGLQSQRGGGQSKDPSMVGRSPGLGSWEEGEWGELGLRLGTSPLVHAPGRPGSQLASWASVG